jgi:hypothetical protein
MWLEGFAIDYIDALCKQFAEVFANADIVEHCRMRRGIEFDEDIEVAVGSTFAARDRTEQRGMANAAGA